MLGLVLHLRHERHSKRKIHSPNNQQTPLGSRRKKKPTDGNCFPLQHVYQTFEFFISCCVFFYIFVCISLVLLFCVLKVCWCFVSDSDDFNLFANSRSKKHCGEPCRPLTTTPDEMRELTIQTQKAVLVSGNRFLVSDQQFLGTSLLVCVFV